MAQSPDIPRTARRVVASLGGPTATPDLSKSKVRKRINRARRVMAKRYGGKA